MTSIQQKQGIQQSQPPLVTNPLQSQINEKQQIQQTYSAIKQQLLIIKQQSILKLEEWIRQIYKYKMKVTQLQHLHQGIQINLSPMNIEIILKRIHNQVCEIHKQLIGEEMRIMLESNSGEYYYKIDTNYSEIGYFDYINVNQQFDINQIKNLQLQTNSTHDQYQQQRLTVNQQYYQYCLWIIYQHFCSMTECNKQICMLIQFIRQNSQGIYFKYYQQIMDPKSLASSLFTSDTQNNCNNQKQESVLENKHHKISDFEKITTLIDQYELIKENQLNILTLTNLIPLAMPKLTDQSNFKHKATAIKSNALTNIQKCQENTHNNQLYDHINKFQLTINSIIYKNKQNMRKYLMYFDQFKRAIKILKNRLRKNNDMKSIEPNNKQNIKQSKKQNALAKQFVGIKQFQKLKQLSNKLFDEKKFEQEMEKKIEKQMQLDGYSLERLSGSEDQAQIVRKIDEIKPNQAHKKQLTGRNSSSSRQENQDKKKFKFTNYNSIKTSSIHSKIANFKALTQLSQKNPFLFDDPSDRKQLFTHFSAKVTENNDENVKFEFVFKKNEINEKVSQQKTLLKKIKQQSSLGFLSTNQILEKKRKVIQKLENIKQQKPPKRIVQKLKKNLNDLGKKQRNKDEQITNYLKLFKKQQLSSQMQQNMQYSLKQARKQTRNFIYYTKQQKSQLNFHQFLQQSQFQEDKQQNECNFNQQELQKLQQMMDKDEKKKKKKKNKKKKNKKQQQSQQANPIQNQKVQNNEVIQSFQEKYKINIKQLQKQVTQYEYEIIKKLISMNIQKDSRAECYKIDQEILNEMKNRQIDNLCKYVKNESRSISKNGKNKKKKVM